MFNCSGSPMLAAIFQVRWNMQAAWDTFQVKRSVLEGTKEVVTTLEGLVKQGKALAYRYVGTIPARGPRKRKMAPVTEAGHKKNMKTLAL